MRKEELHVLLVNGRDEPMGTMEKMAAHEQGLLHRAFSVFLFDAEGRMLLQRRAVTKYHGGGLWSNACCSHPYPDEPVPDAARRRLREELGIEASIEPIFAFTYRAEVENGLTEHEFDHVFAGIYAGPLALNPEEVAECRYVALPELRAEVAAAPGRFTAWFKMVLPRLEEWWQKRSP
ncbi:isopentenyl-diphosphate Delta-isomerase [Flaviaesturariibacter amylovorans]|uniref:Isopentenyl-diphosphate delta-isomerase n=1 Tax=Flaviaesturariibacter amylovorans TaxID=1084520 RepID=A0ABP8GC00_9BACT